jgi:hypothetical protein
VLGTYFEWEWGGCAGYLWAFGQGGLAGVWAGVVEPNSRGLPDVEEGFGRLMPQVKGRAPLRIRAASTSRQRGVWRYSWSCVLANQARAERHFWRVCQRAHWSVLPGSACTVACGEHLEGLHRMAALRSGRLSRVRCVQLPRRPTKAIPYSFYALCKY